MPVRFTPKSTNKPQINLRRLRNENHKLSIKIRGQEERADSVMRGISKQVFRYLSLLIRRSFFTETDPEGNVWPPLSRRRVEEKGHAMILIDSTSLRESLTDTVAPIDGIREVNDLSLKYGSNNFTARAHEQGEHTFSTLIRTIEEDYEGNLDVFDAQFLPNLPKRSFMPHGNQVADYVGARGAEHILGLETGFIKIERPPNVPSYLANPAP